jgi:hypothetical protein
LILKLLFRNIAYSNIEYMRPKQIVISPLDVLILLKIISINDRKWLQMDIAEALEISQSEVSKSLKRLKASWLLAPNNSIVIMRENVLEFLRYGIKYIFPQWPGSVVRGMPTAHSAPVLNNEILSNENYVWPYAKGQVRGQSIIPLYPTVPKACGSDKKLYELLALIDALRIGNAREKDIAYKKLKNRIIFGEYND